VLKIFSPACGTVLLMLIVLRAIASKVRRICIYEFGGKEGRRKKLLRIFI
jgi:hypothetical protein